MVVHRERVDAGDFHRTEHPGRALFWTTTFFLGPLLGFPYRLGFRHLEKNRLASLDQVEARLLDFVANCHLSPDIVRCLLAFVADGIHTRRLPVALPRHVVLFGGTHFARPCDVISFAGDGVCLSREGVRALRNGVGILCDDVRPGSGFLRLLRVVQTDDTHDEAGDAEQPRDDHSNDGRRCHDFIRTYSNIRDSLYVRSRRCPFGQTHSSKEYGIIVGRSFLGRGVHRSLGFIVCVIVSPHWAQSTVIIALLPLQLSVSNGADTVRYPSTTTPLTLLS